ncbi:MAG: EFR1 family ferrodoxin [Bacteroidales bacterium]|nr:EFR1 family ferrodoxin [Bacteroidales bacterium]
MKNIRIDYYTGTGGSQLIAERLAEKLKAENNNVVVNRIYRADIKETRTFDVDYYILIFPVHSFNPPSTIFEWAKHLTANRCKTAIISVAGAGNALTNTACRYKTRKLLKKRGFDVIYQDMVRMPNNWKNVPEKPKYICLLSKLPTKIEKIAQAIATEKRGRKLIYWIDYLLTPLGRTAQNSTHKFGNGINVLDSCTSCGLCAKNCCSSNIKMEANLPKFENRCDMCLGCVYNCPEKALQPTWGAFQVDKKGYDLRSMLQNLDARKEL